MCENCSLYRSIAKDKNNSKRICLKAYALNAIDFEKMQNFLQEVLKNVDNVVFNILVVSLLFGLN